MGPTSLSRKIFLVTEIPTKVLVADAAKSASESEVMQALVVTLLFFLFLTCFLTCKLPSYGTFMS